MQDVIDIAQLDEQTFHDADICREILVMFQGQAPVLLRALEAGHGQQRADAAHRLAGSSLAIGANPLAAAAGDLEKNPQDADALLQVQHLMDATLRQVAGLLSR
jgi:HPt (histidine-containing phosphotransfer) domain-containing protein